MSAQQPKRVKVSDLQDNMTILSFVHFSKRYQPMNTKTCDWIKHNFKGAQAVVKRNGKLSKVAISQITDGDVLHQVYKFPANLKKLTTVNQKSPRTFWKVRNCLNLTAKRCSS